MALRAAAVAACAALTWLLCFSPLCVPYFPPPPKGGAIIVSGAGSGIGLDAAKGLARQGYTVFAGVRKERDAAAVRAEGVPGLRPVLLDVTDPKSVAAAVAEAARSGPLVGVVNNAGVGSDLPAEMLGDGAGDVPLMRQVLEVNSLGPARLTAASLPAMREAGGGRLVYVTSLAGRMANPGQAAYSASKFALEGYADAVRRDLIASGQRNISVSVITPGCIGTPFFGKATADKQWTEPGSSPVGQLYARLFQMKKDNFEVCSTHAGPEGTSTPDILHAVTSDYPRTRYYPGGWNGIPARGIALLAWALPDRVLDLMITS
eukprot:TRINITY_DN5094_c0_g1_i1.p1 TRINITY_DN5094_c0_g1~~TRINITY_DN5094_c0_g1_i1.p1  ORF type:complete len:339 (+),score=107.78 TRINITY_DN5094_c0_g1_i1:63-1019(+)